MLQVDNTQTSHTLSLPRFSIFFNKFKKNGVKSKNYPQDGLDPRLPYLIFNPIFHFMFFNEFERNGIYSANSPANG